MPYPEEAEHELVAAVFVDHRVIEDHSDLVTGADFYDRRLGGWWDAMGEIVRRDGRLDFPLLRAMVRERGALERLGGDEFLGRIMERSGSTAAVSRYAYEVRQYARRRAVMEAAERVTIDGHGHIEDVDTFCMNAEESIRRAAEGKAVHRFVTPFESTRAVLDMATKVSEVDDQRRGIPTGLPSFDESFTFGGLPRKLVVIAARPKMGKTNLAVQFALTMALQGHHGVFFSMEMEHQEITARMVSNLARINSKKIMGHLPIVDPDELSRLWGAADKVSALPFLIDDTPRLSAHQIRSRVGRARRQIAEKTGKDRPLSWAVVDYFNIMNHPSGGGTRRSDEIMGDSSGILTDMSKEGSMTTLLLVQFNRKPEEKPDKIPEIHHLRECGALEQDAALILSPFWPYWYGQNGTGMYRDARPEDAQLLVMANRFGGMGKIDLRFEPENHRYYEPGFSDPLYGRTAA